LRAAGQDLGRRREEDRRRSGSRADRAEGLAHEIQRAGAVRDYFVYSMKRRAAFSPSPRLRGEGWGTLRESGVSRYTCTPSPAAQERVDLSPQAGRGEKDRNMQRAAMDRF